MHKAYIIGGGPSLNGFNWDELPVEDTIAVNAAVFNVTHPHHFITMDYTFFKKIRAKHKHFKTLKCTKWFVAGLHHPYLVEFQGAFCDKRTRRMVYDLSLCDTIIKSYRADGCGFTWSDFRSGENSGFSALQLAVLLGYNEICLLGLDLVTQNSKTHYHCLYPQSFSSFEKKLALYVERFRQGLKDIQRHGGIRVVSCSPKCPLNDTIEYLPFEETL